jgi:hypothetical protein
MKKILLTFVFALALTNLMAQSVGDYKTTAATTFNTSANWARWDGSNWISPAPFAPGGNSLAVTQTVNGAVTSSTAVTLNSNSIYNNYIRAGQYVTGTGITAGTTVNSISGTSLTLSQAATLANNAVLTFAESFTIASSVISGTSVTLGSSNAAVVAGMAVTGTGITAGTKVASVTGNPVTSITLSTSATSGTQTLTFYSLQTSASFASGASTITLGAQNSLVTTGMTLYVSGVPGGARITSFTNNSDGTETLGISIPTTSASTGTNVVFGYLVIPNLNIYHTVSTSTNTRQTSIGNVTVYSGGNLTIGTAATTGNDLVCNTTTVNNGGNLGTTNFTGTAQTNTVEITGGIGGNCFVNNGTVDFTTTTGGASVTNITFMIPGNSTMSGSGTTNFNKITMNMCGVQANTLDVQSVFSMLAATSAPTLTLTSGTLKISSASTITPFGGDGSSGNNAIPVLAGLYLNNAGLTLNYGTAAAAGGYAISMKGALTLAAGTLYLKGRYDANTTGVTTISGGTLEIPAGLTITNTGAALFHMGGTHSFFMSGGNINLKSHNTGSYGNPDYYNVASVQSLTGGTITFSDAATMYSNSSRFYNLTIQNGDGSGTTLTRASTATTILNNLTVGAGSTLENGTNNFIPSFTINGNTTIDLYTVALQSSGCVAVGQYLQGTGIPANTTVTGITQTQTTGIVTSGTNQVTGVPTNSGYTAASSNGSMIFGNGIAPGTTVTGIAGTGPYTLTLSANATASSTTAEVLIINPVITMSNKATATSTPGQVLFYNATAFTNTGTGTINIQSTSNPAYPASATWASTMNFSGSLGSQNLLTGTYSNVIINNTNATPVVNMQNGSSSYVTGNGASTINGTLTLTSGTLTLNGKSLTLTGGISGTGSKIDASSGILAFGGTSEQALDGTNVTSNIVNNLVINAGSKLTTTGTLSATNLTINSTTDGGTGSLTGTLKGTLTSTAASINQYLTNRTWYLSSPVSSATPANMSVIKYFNEKVAGNVWVDATTMTAGTGYLVAPNNATYANNILFSGTLNTGSQPITLTRSTDNTDYPGFNLIGNPYPSYLDWTAVCNYTTDGGSTYPNQTIMPTTTMWYRTNTTGSWGFVTVNGAGVTSPTGYVTKYIPPMQAFWVRANADAVQLQLNNSMCSHAAISNPLKAPAAKNAEQLQLVRLQVNNGTITDEAVIYFSANAKNGFDIYDAPKMKNSDITVPGIYTLLNNEQIVINAMNTIPLNQEISLGFVPGSASSFSIKANEVSNLPSGVKLILKDNVTKVETDLTNGVTGYNFTSSTAADSRFSIIFRTTGSATDIVDNTDNRNISVYRNANNQIAVSCPSDISENAFISVYNGLGQKLESKHLTSAITVIDKTFNSGVYVVTVTNGGKSITKKVILN